MLDNDNSGQAGQENLDNSQASCSSTSGSSGCCSPDSDSGGKTWKLLIFVVVLAAAGIVLARSFVKQSNSTTDQTPQAFAAIPTQENATAKEATSDGTELALWGPELDSLASLNEVALEIDAVFILVSGENQQGTQDIISEIEAATKKVRARGNRISAFSLKKDATDYEELAKQFSVPSVVAMVKGCGLNAVSGEITEEKLLQAYVTASRAPSGCCSPGAGPAGCGPSGCGPSGCE